MTKAREVFAFEGTNGNRLRLVARGGITNESIESLEDFIRLTRKAFEAPRHTLEHDGGVLKPDDRGTEATIAENSNK